MANNVLLEERWNARSHAIGALLALCGVVLLFSTPMGHELQLGMLAYGASLVLLFVSSTIYHATSNPKRKTKLRILDHISIYYLIAGTYTPVCMTLLAPSRGVLLLWLVWGIAVFGTFMKLFFTGKYEVFSLVLYGVMGWLIVIDLIALIKIATTYQLTTLAFGGAFYTIGIIFYATRAIPFNHFIWHLFVLAGATSHWLLIYSLV